jgi:RimJ/RimL family protein N-acetyltransferase/predicted GNAT family acetyltransferase
VAEQMGAASAEQVAVRAATLADVEDWRALAREVEGLFGAPMADAPTWNEGLVRSIERGSAWCAIGAASDAGRGALLGGMTRSRADAEQPHINWLAVRRDARGQGAGRALVTHAIATADGRALRVVTFGEGHPGGAEAEHARRLYRALGFVEESMGVASPDGTPREQLVWDDVVLRGDGIFLRPLRQADATTHHAGEDDVQLRGFEFPGPASLARVEAAIAEWRWSWAARGPVRNFGIWSAATGGLVGNVEVRVLDGHDVNLSYLVFPEWRRRGVATRAARLALEYGRTQLGARRARIEVLAENTASLGVVRRLGARSTGAVQRPTGSRYLTFSLDL